MPMWWTRASEADDHKDGDLIYPRRAKMKIMKIVVLMVLALSPQQKVLGQDNSALLAQIKSSIVKTEPKWRLVRKQQTKRGDYVGYDLKSGKSSVYIFVAFYKSTKDAANGLRNLPCLFEEGGLRMTVLPTTIPNLGDENYTWEDCCDKRFKGIAFRKDKIVVHVDAPSIEIAQRFASHVAEALAANASATERPSPLPFEEETVKGAEPLEASIATTAEKGF